MKNYGPMHKPHVTAYRLWAPQIALGGEKHSVKLFLLMNQIRAFLAVLCLTILASNTFAAAAPLRIFLRGGAKTHGPAGNGLHDHEHWLADWQKLLATRGG
jgi:hypothetical protein